MVPHCHSNVVAAPDPSVSPGVWVHGLIFGCFNTWPAGLISISQHLGVCRASGRCWYPLSLRRAALVWSYPCSGGRRPESPDDSPGGICCHCTPVETPQPWSRGAFPLSVTEADGDLVNAVYGTLLFLPPALRSWLCARGELVKLLLQPKVSHPLSVGDVCGSHAVEHPKGRPVSSTCRGGQLSPVTETWVSSMGQDPSFLTLLSFSPVSYNTHGSRRPFSDPYRGHSQHLWFGLKLPWCQA